MATPTSTIDPRFFDESTLVVPLPVARPTIWLLQLAGCVILIFAAYLTMLHGAKSADRPPITTDDEHRQQIIRYLLTDQPQTVFVGSSLTHALKPEYFSRPDYSNLALPGGSPMTGLMLIGNSGHLPQVLIIETNILGEKANLELLEYFRPLPGPLEETRRLIRDFKPVRTGLCQILGVDPSSDTMQKKALPPGDRRVSYQKRKVELLTQAPTNHDTAEAVARALHKPSDQLEPIARANAQAIVQYAEQMEAQGVRVYLLEMPLMPEIKNGPYSSTVHREIEEANAARPDRWLRLDLDQSQLRWADAYHLDERSNILVIQAIEQKLQNDLKTPR